ncbi:MAG TPA: chlorosome envelope protein B [Chlorobaculum sp.]|nr:chlorosome envelope protein B [Chlorobaculum sp.]
MANETPNEFSSALDNLVETLGKLGQIQIDLVANGIKSAASAFEPLSKSSVELAEGAVNAVNQLLQNVASAIAPKQ